MTTIPTASELDGELLLGTVAVEPNRWGTIRPDRSAGSACSDSAALEFVAGLLTDQDHPAGLLDQAAVDLALLRPMLKGT